MENLQLETTAREYKELQASIKELEEQAETLKQAMIKELDRVQADRVQAGPFSIRYTLVESSRLDTKALKNDHATGLK
jgi:predicted phage-related endonuclease